MVEDLGRRVSLALDNNHLYESARQAQARLALVARAGVTLTSSLDLVTVMGRLYDLIAGEISERCEVHVRRPPGQWWRFRSGPARPGLVRADSLPDRVSEAVDSGAPMVGRWPTGEVFSGPVTVNGDESPACSIIPLVAHGEPVGVIALCLPGPGEPVHLPAETVEVIAGRAALAVDNALLYEQERSAAEILQRSLLPHRLPAFPGLQAAARYLPAGARNEIGGDWYDLFRLGPDRVGMVMGDVMGRGIPAASVMGQLRNGLRMLAVQGIEPHRALELLNRMLGPDLGDELEPFATVGYGVLDLPSGRLMLASAGHLPPLLRRGETTRYLDQRPGPPLGAFPEAAYECTEHQLEPGDALVMYTDGLIERRDRTLAEGMEALLRSVSELSLNGPDTLCDRVLEDLRSRSEEDDTAVLVIRMNEA
jgi:hypothetical protein